MFLWIRLVIFTLADLHFESDVRKAIETLPEDLEAVYMRPLYNHSYIVLISVQGTREYSYAFVATVKPPISV